jgi:hypothetical protein
MKMIKLFYNALSYDEYAGWYISEPRELPFKSEGLKDDEFYAKLAIIRKHLEQEILDVCLYLKLEVEEVGGYTPVLDEENGKKLTEELLRRGWKKEFIPIGP